MSKFKVGDKVRAINDDNVDFVYRTGDIGTVVKIDDGDEVQPYLVDWYNGKKHDWPYAVDIEPVKEEPEEQRVKDSGAIYRTSPQHDFERIHLYGFDVKITDNVEDKLKDYKPKKKTIMRSISNAIKKVLPGDEQNLYKVGLLNSDLELSGRAQEMYVQALYENEGDHKKAKAELVAYAEEQIKEEENN